MRQVLSVLVPLLLPTLLYFLYAGVAARRAEAAGGDWAREVPWTWLAVAGGALVVVTFVAFALFGGADPGSVYHPPRAVDGKVEPGYFE